MKNILVVVDMQKDFVDGALGSPEAVAIVPAVAEKIRNWEGGIIVTYDTHPDNYLETQEGHRLPVPHCIHGTEGWQLDAAVQDALEGRDFCALLKRTFGSDQLPDVVAEMAGEEPFAVTFIGLCTDICVVSNALLLKAFFPEAPMSVDARCCAGVTPAKHEAALETLRSCQFDVI